MDYLSLCLIARNEGDYLKEWVDYHLLLGVERFYIYDNESAEPIRITLDEYIRAGWVVVNEIAGQGQQLFAYDHCLQSYGKNSRWIGFIDTDEFLVPKSTESLPGFLSDYEAFAGLAISSLFFGANNIRKKPIGGQIASYTQRAPRTFRGSRLVKSIVQPDRILWPMSPHLFVCKDNGFIVNEDKQRVDNQIFTHRSEKIQLNHYFTRSFEEIEEKLKRGRGDAGLAYPNSRFDVINRAATEKDTEIISLLGRLLPDADLKKAGPNSPSVLEALHSAALRLKPVPFPSQTVSAELRRPIFISYQEKVDLANTMRDQRDWDGVLRLKSELIEMAPSCIAHRTDFAAICLQKGEMPLAWNAITRAWKAAPQSLLVLQAMADYYLRMKDYAWLEKISQMIINLSPNENTSYYPLSIALIKQGQDDKGVQLALNILPDLLDGNPNEQTRAFLLIKTITPLLFARNEIETINRLTQIAILLNPQDVSLFTTLIRMNIELKKTKTADEVIEQALKIHPDNAEILALKTAVRSRGRQYNN
jgi:hypothetical protein